MRPIHFRRLSASVPAAAIVGLVGSGLLGCGEREGDAPAPPGSRVTVEVRDSGPTWELAAPMYTPAQADEGESVFRGVCSFCHAPADFTSPGFQAMWTGMSVGELLEFISTAMPQDNPGGLREEDYAAVLSYILRENGLPSGEHELEPDLRELRRHTLERPGE